MANPQLRRFLYHLHEVHSMKPCLPCLHWSLESFWSHTPKLWITKGRCNKGTTKTKTKHNESAHPAQRHPNTPQTVKNWTIFNRIAEKQSRHGRKKSSLIESTSIKARGTKEWDRRQWNCDGVRRCLVYYFDVLFLLCVLHVKVIQKCIGALSDQMRKCRTKMTRR